MKIAKYALDNWVDLREYTPPTLCAPRELMVTERTLNALYDLCAHIYIAA